MCCSEEFEKLKQGEKESRDKLAHLKRSLETEHRDHQSDVDQRNEETMKLKVLSPRHSPVLPQQPRSCSHHIARRTVAAADGGVQRWIYTSSGTNRRWRPPT